MRSHHSLLQLTPSRAAAALARLRRETWTEVAALALRATQASPLHRSLQEARRDRLSPVNLPQTWGRLWDQRWFRLDVPAELARRNDLYLEWNDQAEATLYVEGSPHYGFDVAHRRAPLPRGARELWVEGVVAQTGIWHPEATGLDPAGSRLAGARVVARNDLLWELYHDLLVPYELALDELKREFGTEAARFSTFGFRPALENASPLLRRLLRALEDGIDALETAGPRAARRALRRGLAALPPDLSAPRAVLTGHAHIDLVWLWPEKVGEFKAVHTFATANRLMDRYPEFRFGYSQPASYAAVGRRSPEMLRAARRRLRQGRWEATGATEVESDCLLACGEALARSFLVGQEGFAELRGEPASVLWLPDVFGYPACLPQLMREAGVESFYTTKLSWSAVTRFPYSSFVWRGHDGSEVLAHLTHEGGYNQEAKPEQLRNGVRAHRQADVHPEFLAPTGFGDGGGGPTEEMCERVRRLSRLAGVPRPAWGRIEPFFARLARLRRKLPVYQGELYLEYHRGTYTTHGAIKAAMRGAERALQALEAVRCATSGRPAPREDWRRTIFAQFHDYVTGSSIHEVYAEGGAELEALSERSLRTAAAELGASRGESAWFNPLPRPRTVARSVGKDGRVETAVLPPLSGAPVAALAAGPALTPVTAAARRLANGRVLAAFDEQGRVSALSIDGVSVALAAPLGELVIHPDRPALFEAWDIDRPAMALGVPVRSRARIEVEQTDGRRASLVCRRSLGKAGEVTLRYTLEAGVPVLGLTVEVDWRQPEAMLKVLFPTKYAGTNARFAAPFGSVLRRQVPGDVASEAQWEVPASRWAAVSDDAEREGLFVVTKDKYGFSCRDGVLGLTLLRSAAITCEGADTHARASHPPSLRRTRAAAKFSDLGSHRIELAIGRHDAGAPRDEQPAAWADLLFTPVLPYRGRAYGAGFLGLEGGETLQPVWAKPAGRGRWVLRLNETLGRRGVATLRLAQGWRARRVNLREQPVGPATSVRRIAYTPYALVSLLIERVG